MTGGGSNGTRPPRFARGVGEILRVLGVLLVGVGICLFLVVCRDMRLADDIERGRASWADPGDSSDAARMNAEFRARIASQLALAVFALFGGTTCIVFGWGLGRCRVGGAAVGSAADAAEAPRPR